MRFFENSRRRAARLARETRARRLRALPSVETLEPLMLLVTNPIVTNTNPSGPGSLADALANDGSGHIKFNITGGTTETIDGHTIYYIAGDYTMSDGDFLDGGSEPGYTNYPMVAIQGLTLSGSDNVQNLAIEKLTLTSTYNSVEGSRLNQVHLAGSDYNTIGGTAAGQGNTIVGGVVGSGDWLGAAGNSTYAGVVLTGSDHNTIVGNTIVGPAGAVGIDNYFGVVLADGSASNTIGGTTSAARNVITGEDATEEGDYGVNATYGAGILLTGGATSNIVEGNWIGTADGTTAAPNDYGIILSGATNNTIGGAASGAGNVISGNVRDGVLITGSGSTGNTAAGNAIGTNPAGTAAIANGGAGVEIAVAAASNTIGGTATGATNVISGNTSDGVRITGSGTSSNRVVGDLIGTNAAGTAAIANGGFGVLVSAMATSNLIGGTAAGSGDLISGNVAGGVALRDSGTSSNTVQGNRIGTAGSGTAALGNAAAGVLIGAGASGNTVGGTSSSARNVISGNLGGGVVVTGSGTATNVVAGNYIGVDSTGAAALANTGFGLVVSASASGNTIGGTTTGSGNVISANTAGGVSITDTGTSNNTVAGNLIGINASGTQALGNAVAGVVIASHASGNTIGGTTAAAANTISGNTGYGVEATGSGTTGNTIEGNLIGTTSDGTAALANGSVGVYVAGGAAGNTIGGTTASARNVVSGNTGVGVELTGSGTTNNAVAGNDIGTNAAGTAALGNGSFGVLVSAAAATNTIGGSVPGAGNLISGNLSYGVELTGAGTSGNAIRGNVIGLNAAGSAALTNATVGVIIAGGASNNTVGGTDAGARNVISGNSDQNLTITGVGTSSNVVEGNYIGTDPTGTAGFGTSGVGVLVWNGASGNTIGGAAAGAGNVISGNHGYGVELSGSGTTNNAVAGNYIGTDAAGTAALGNSTYGVLISASATANTVGGTATGAGNVISGNLIVGVEINGASGDFVQGNLIGTTADGSAALANGSAGILLKGGASHNTIGGTDDGARNVISGNSATDVSISDAGTSFNTVAGNYIGLNATGTASLASSLGGVYITNAASSNTIGGNSDAARNIISGVGGVAVEITGAGTTANLVEGNYLGTDPAGDAAIGDLQGGVLIINGASGNTIGGPDSGDGNVISGNGDFSSLHPTSGIEIKGTGTSGNVVAGNFIGINADGTAPLGNADAGVRIDTGASGNTIGGTTAGARNVISGNLKDGIDLYGAGTSGNLVEGNDIGTDETGEAALGNSGHGILLFAGASGNTIGGTTAGARNVISGNVAIAVSIHDAGTSGNVVEGNYIGTDATGEAAIGNHQDAVQISLGASGNTIGGTTQGAGNVISGNFGNGVYLTGTSNNLVAGNYIGTDAAGEAALGNSSAGVAIGSGATGNIVGGTTEYARNVISGNLSNGVQIVNAGTSGNVVEGNIIGLDADGTAALGNLAIGVAVASSASGNTIGGTDPGAGNLIADNGRAGVVVGSTNTDTASGNAILGNSIFGNARLGIDLGNDGVTANSPGGPHSGPDHLQNSPVLSAAGSNADGTMVDGTLASTPDTTFRVEFFANPSADNSGYGEGKTYLGFVDVHTDDGGNATFAAVLNKTAPLGEVISATATDPDGNTSEFSHDSTPVVKRPEASDASLTVDNSDSLVGSVHATDFVGNSLSYSGVTQPAHGSLLLEADGTFTYTPAPGFFGLDSFAYQADDGLFTSNTATVTISVTGHAPVASNDSYTLAYGDTLTTTTANGVLHNDADSAGHVLTATRVSNVQHGTLAFNLDGTFTYTPSAGFFGTDSFTYKANYGEAESNVATASIIVSSLSDGTGLTIQQVAGSTFDGTVATFLENNPGVAAGQYVATIRWGDQTSSPGTVSVAGGTVSVQGSHAYAEAGSFGIAVRLVGVGGSTASAAASAVIADAPLTPVAGTTFQVSPGTKYQGLVGHFDDANSLAHPADFSATIHWGDGTPDTPGLVVGTGGAYGVSGTHVYSGDAASYAVTVTVHDTAGGSVTISSVAQVRGATLSGSGVALSALSGSTVSATVASFTLTPSNAPSTGLTATIDWGDGTTPTTGTIHPGSAPGDYDVTGTHTYSTSSPTVVHVTMANGPGSTIVVESPISFHSSGTGTGGGTGRGGVTYQLVNIVPTAGLRFNSRVATFNDPNTSHTAGSFSATINWGDGTTSTGTVTADPSGGFDVTGDHTYTSESEGDVGITVDVSSPDGAGFSSEEEAEVAKEKLDVSLEPLEEAFESPYGLVRFDGAVASFVAPNRDEGPSDYTATIDWGDDTEPANATITGNATQGFLVNALHYFPDQGGEFEVTVTVVDPEGTKTVEHHMIEVASPPVELQTGTIDATAGIEFHGQLDSIYGTFEPADDFEATIDWGDGSTSSGTVGSASPDSSASMITGDHIYEHGGTYVVRVEIENARGEVSTSQAIAYVSEPTKQQQEQDLGEDVGELEVGIRDVPYFVNDWTAESGDASRFSATTSTTSIDWGDGETTEFTGNGYSFVQYINQWFNSLIEQDSFYNENLMDTPIVHVYKENGVHTVKMTVTSPNGEQATYQELVSISDPALAATIEDENSSPGQVWIDGALSTVAKFVDTNPTLTADDYSALVDWGDGTVSEGVIVGGLGNFSVEAAHTYTEAGRYDVKLELAALDGGSTTAYGRAFAYPPGPIDSTLTLRGVNEEAEVDQEFSGTVATFSDPDLDDSTEDFTATINWGDGTSSTGTVTGSDGQFSIEGDHIYHDSKEFRPSIRLTHSGENQQDFDETTIRVLYAEIEGTPEAPDENHGVVSGTIAELSGLSGTHTTYTAVIDWGDGTSSISNLSPGNSETAEISGSHGYTHNGHYDIVVRVAELNEYAGGGEGDVVINIPVDVSDVNPPSTPTLPGTAINGTNMVMSGMTVAASEGEEYDGPVATFEDNHDGASAGDFIAYIAWGDGEISKGFIYSIDAGFEIDGDHKFTTSGNYPVSVSVIDKRYGLSSYTGENAPPDLPAGPSAGYYGYGDLGWNWAGGWVGGVGTSYEFSVESTAEVARASLTLTGNSPEEVTSGEEATDAVLATGSIDDGNPLDSFTGLVAWGDGSVTALVVSSEDGEFEILNDHVYDTPGKYTVAITLHDGTVDYEATCKVTVDPPASEEDDPDRSQLEAEAEDISGSTGEELEDELVATFTDENPPHIGGLHQAIIDWGDGTTSEGKVEADSEDHKYDVRGDHVYANPGEYILHVTIQDQPDTTTASGIATIKGDRIHATGTDLDDLFSRKDVVVARFTDEDHDDTASSFQATINLGTNMPDLIGEVHGGDGEFYVTLPGPGNFDSYPQAIEMSSGQLQGSEVALEIYEYEAFKYSYWMYGEGELSLPWNEPQSFWGAYYSGYLDEYVGLEWNGNQAPYSYDYINGTYSGNISPGDRDITVTISDANTVVATAHSTLVAEQAVAGTAVTPTLLITASFDPNYYGYRLTDWGDGTAATGTSHIYQHEGTYTITYEQYRVEQVSGADGIGYLTHTDMGPLTQEITVVDAPLIPLFTDPGPISGVAGDELDDVPLFTFKDADPDGEAEDDTATIDWGDGTTSDGTIERNDQGVFDVHGTHTYDRGGNFTITVLVEDEGGSQAIGYQPASIALDVEGKDFGSFSNVPTGQVVLATIKDSTGHDAANPTATVDWGDDSTSTATIVYDEDDKEYEVLGDHIYGETGTFDVHVAIVEGGVTTYTGGKATIIADWTVTGGQRIDDPEEASTEDLGRAQVALDTGGLSVAEPLDFDLSPGTSVGGDPELFYNSDTVDVRPILEAQLKGSPDDPVPVSIKVQLTWDGVTQDWVELETDGQEPGDSYVVSAQVEDAVAKSGLYAWSLHVVMDFGDDRPEFNAEVTGLARVVVNASPEPDPEKPFETIDFLGAGWGISGIDRLVPEADDNGDVLWVTGTGDSRAFIRKDDGTFVDPANVFGKLEEGEDHSFTYTATDQTRYEFDKFGLLTEIVDSDGVAISYSYTEEGQLEEVTAPDGSVTTFTYDPETLLLETISEPGGRELELGHDPSGDLAQITDADDTERTFAYTSEGRLEEDKSGPLELDGSVNADAHFTYDPDTGSLELVDDGDGSEYRITTPDRAILDGGKAVDIDRAAASVEDAHDHTTTYQLDDEGRLLKEIDAEGNTQTWKRDSHGQVTVFTDAKGQIIKDFYDYSKDGDGNLLRVENPDGTYLSYQYDSKFDEVSREERSGPGGSAEATVNTYDEATGDLLTTTDPLGNVTTYEWSDGLLQEMTDARHQTTLYEYDDDRRLVRVTDPLSDSTSYTYDDDGNIATTTDALDRTTSTTYDAEGRLTEEEDPEGETSTIKYNALGEEVERVDGDDITTIMEYDDRGFLTETTEAYGEEDERSSYTYYDEDGNATTLVDAKGITTVNAYDEDNRLTSVTEAYGEDVERTSYTYYDEDGNVTTTVDGKGITTVEKYDSEDRVTETIEASGTPEERTSYTYYDEAGNATTLVDGKGLVTVNGYDEDNRLTSTTEAYGEDAERTSYTYYDEDGNVTTTIDGDNITTVNAYDEDDRLTATTEAYGTSVARTSYTYYDAAGNATTLVDWHGVTTVNAYDGDDRVTSTTEAFGTGVARTSKTYYDHDGNVTTTVDGRGITTVTAYDALDRPTLVTEADGVTGVEQTERTYYDADDNVTTTVDEYGTTTVTAYDALDRATLITEAYGTSVQRTEQTLYDADDDVTTTVDGNGNVTQTDYDSLNRATLVTEAVGTDVQRAEETYYDADDNATTTIDGNGNVTVTEYDALGRATLVTEAYGTSVQRTEETRYDADDDVTTTVDGNGTTTVTAYDKLDRPTLVTEAYGESIQRSESTRYDDDDNATFAVDGEGHTTVTAYDDLYRATEVTEAYGTSAQESSYTYYDADDNVTTVIDADGNTTAFQFDALNRQVRTTDPLGHSATDAYDTAAHQVTTTDRDGRVSRMSFDALDRLVGEQWYDSGGDLTDTRAFTYDDDDNLLTASDHLGATVDSFTYDALDRIATATDPFDVTLSYSYDADDNALDVTDSLGGSVISTYDPLDRLSTRELVGDGSTSPQVDFTYDADDDLLSMTRFADAGDHDPIGSSTYGYDALDRLTSLEQTGPSGSSLEDYTYAYDDADRLTSEERNGETTSYTYDAADQLTGAGDTTYSYDANGNRTDGGFSPGPENQVLSDGTWDYSYDDEGNRISKVDIETHVSWIYTYDNDNELTGAKELAGDGTTVDEQVSFSYDAQGHRIEETVSPGGPSVSTSTRFVVDGDQDVVADLDANDNLETRYLYGAAVDQILARIGESGVVAWYLTDHLGSVRDITDAAGAVQDHIDYGEFGQVTSESDPSFGDRFKYTGREYDTTTGLQFNRDRYYDAAIGSWISLDPSGFRSGDTNLYRYAGNSPTNLIDPSGLEGLPSHLTGLVAAPTDRGSSNYGQKWIGEGQNQRLVPRGEITPARGSERTYGAAFIYVPTEREERNINRIEAGVNAAGSLGEIFVGILLLPETFGASSAVIGLGLDGLIADTKTIESGRHADPLLAQGITWATGKAGVDRETAVAYGQVGNGATHLVVGLATIAKFESLEVAQAMKGQPPFFLDQISKPPITESMGSVGANAVPGSGSLSISPGSTEIFVLDTEGRVLDTLPLVAGGSPTNVPHRSPSEIFEALEEFRNELGPIPSQKLPDGGTLVYLEETGTYGVSAHGQNALAKETWKGIISPREQTLFHGEGDLFTQLKTSGWKGDSEQTYRLFVHQTGRIFVCPSCDNHMTDYMSAVNIHKLDVHLMDGTLFWYTTGRPRGKGVWK